MNRSRTMRSTVRHCATATLAFALAAGFGAGLLAAPTATAGATSAEDGRKAEWQDRYRTIRNNAVRMRDNATKLQRAYKLSQHSNYPRGGARTRFKQQVEESLQKADDYEAQQQRFLDEARANQIPPGWIYEVDEEPVDPGAPASAMANGEATHAKPAPEGRNPAFYEKGDNRYQDDRKEEEGDERGEEYDDFADDRDDQYRVKDLKPDEEGF